MRIVTTETKVYTYDELDNDAKERARSAYLETREPYFFTDMVIADLRGAFPNSDLSVGYSLSYSQGDGLNVYGEVSLDDVLRYMGTDANAIWTGKQIRTLKHYADECGYIHLPENTTLYEYCYVDRCDVAYKWESELEYACYANINRDVLDTLQNVVVDVFTKLCSQYEEWGYDYFYEITDEDMKETCDANGYEFTEDGSFYW